MTHTNYKYNTFDNLRILQHHLVNQNDRQEDYPLHNIFPPFQSTRQLPGAKKNLKHYNSLDNFKKSPSKRSVVLPQLPEFSSTTRTPPNHHQQFNSRTTQFSVLQIRFLSNIDNFNVLRISITPPTVQSLPSTAANFLGLVSSLTSTISTPSHSLSKSFPSIALSPTGTTTASTVC